MIDQYQNKQQSFCDVAKVFFNPMTDDEMYDYIKSKDPTLIGGIGGQVKSETGEDDTIEEIIA